MFLFSVLEFPYHLMRYIRSAETFGMVIHSFVTSIDMENVGRVEKSCYQIKGTRNERSDTS